MQNMQNMQNKCLTPRAYLWGATALALLTALLRGLSLALAFDPHGGYFTHDALPLLYRITALLSLVALALFPLLFLKDKVACPRAPLSHAGVCGAALSAMLLFLNFIGGCALQSATLPALLWLVGLLALLLSIVYFILQTPLLKAGVNTHATLGSVTILALACLIAFTYFDVATPMNAPHKMDLHAALLGVILYLLHELRAKAGIGRPLLQCTFGGIALFLCASVGLSDTVAYLTGTFTAPLYLAEDLLLLPLAVYIGARLAATPNSERKDNAV